MSIKFELDKEQETKFTEWSVEQHKKAKAITDKEREDGKWKSSTIYGFGGCPFVWEFSPCMIITGVKVRNTITKEELDLTPDSSTW